MISFYECLDVKKGKSEFCTIKLLQSFLSEKRSLWTAVRLLLMPTTIIRIGSKILTRGITDDSILLTRPEGMDGRQLMQTKTTSEWSRRHTGSIKIAWWTRTFFLYAVSYLKSCRTVRIVFMPSFFFSGNLETYMPFLGEN